MWDNLIATQQTANSSGWYDQAKIAAALGKTQAGADGRKILTNDQLLSIANTIAAPKWVPESKSWSFDTDGQGGQGYVTTPGYFVSSNGTILQSPDGGKTFTDKYNNPTGNGSHDQASVTYQLDGKGNAVPVAANNGYSEGDWTGTFRPAAEMLGTVLTAGAAGAALAGGAAGGAAAGGGAGALGSSGVTNAALIESGLGTAGYGASSGASLAGLGEAAAAGGAGAATAGADTAINAGIDTVGTTATGADTAINAGIDAVGTQGATSATATLTNMAKQAGTSLVDYLKTPGGLKALAALGTTAAAALSGSGSSNASGSIASATDAAAKTAQMGQDQVAFNQAAYAAGQPTRDAATASALQTQQAQTAAMNSATASAANLNDLNTGTFQPLEKKIVADAQNYDTAGRRADAVAAARATTEGAYDTAATGLQQSLGRAGITPGSGRALAQMGDASYAKAGAIAGATTDAVRNVETTANQRQLAAAALGANLPTQANAALGTGISAGNASTNAGTAAITDQSAGIPQMNVGFAGGINGTAAAGSLYNNTAKTTQASDAADAALWGQLGAAAGQYLVSSDENVKDNTDTPEDGNSALDQIDKLKVKDGWTYKDDPIGRPRTGPMAQNVRASMGDAVAPDGKQVDLVSMNGKVLAGMQALHKKVKKLEKRAA